MDGRGRTPGPEGLLEHAAWARRLARSLVADAATADDVVQETWLAATRSPPQADRPVRPWLARVLRNVVRQRARGESRRSAREIAAAADEALPGPEELVERLDSQRVLAEELAALDEPFRTTVLLRYFEDLEPAEIARRQGLPGGTVRWRLKRGLDELRVRLDARFGDRRRWALLLVPLARVGAPPPALPVEPAASAATSSMATTGGTAALTGALVMSTGIKVGAALAAGLAVALGLIATGWIPTDGLPWSREAPLEVAFRPLAEPPAAGEAASAVPDASANAVREVVASPAAPLELPQAVQTSMRLHAGVFDAGGAPLMGGTLRTTAEPAVSSRPSGPDGALSLELDVSEARGSTSLVIERAGYASQLAEVRREPGAEVHVGNFRLDPGGAISGRVLGPDGRGVADVLVTIGEASPPRASLEQRRYRFYVDQPPRTRTSADGSYLLLGVVEGFARVWANGEGWLASSSPPVEVRAGLESVGVEVELEPLLDVLQVRGVVRAPDGTPVAFAGLDFVLQEEQGTMSGNREADERGRFRWVIPPGGRLDLTASDPQGRFGAVTRRELGGGDVDVELRLGRLREVELAVRSSDGTPVESFDVDLLDEDGFTPLDGAERFQEMPREHPGGVARLLLPAQAFVLRVRAPGFALLREGPLSEAAIGERLEVTLQPVPGLRGRVLANGAALGGARVELLVCPTDAQRITNGDFTLRVDPFPRDRTESDAEGRFLLTPREARRYLVRAELEGFAPGMAGPFELDPARGVADLELELGPGGALEGRGLVPPGPDPAGTIVGISCGDGHPRTQRVGPDGAFRFEGLTPGPWQVRRLELQGYAGIGISSAGREAPEIDWDCIVEAGRTTRFDLDLTGGGRCLLGGRLRFDGRAPEGWSASLHEGDPWTGGSIARDGVDPDGAFELEAPRPGRYTLNLERGGPAGEQRLLHLELELGVGLTPWELDLPTGALTLERTGGEGLVLLSTRADGISSLIALEPDAGGRCELADVPAGPARIVRLGDVPDPRSWPTLMTVEVRAGERVTGTLP